MTRFEGVSRGPLSERERLEVWVRRKCPDGRDSLSPDGVDGGEFVEVAFGEYSELVYTKFHL